MDQSEHLSRDGVFEVGYFPVTLDLEAAGNYLLRWFRLAAEKFPIPSWIASLGLECKCRSPQPGTKALLPRRSQGLWKMK